MSTGKPALKPVKTKPAKGDVTGQWSYEDGTFECSVPYAPVANKVSGFAIGNCRQGVDLHRYRGFARPAARGRGSA
jgi:hypothetical protein